MKLVSSLLLALTCFTAHGGAILSDGSNLSAVTGTAIDKNNFSEFGGLIVDLVGKNKSPVTYYIDGSDLYAAVVNPLRDRDSAYTAQLGIWDAAGAINKNNLGSAFGQELVSASFRFSLWDADNRPSDPEDPDANSNFLAINGIAAGNFSDIDTITHNREGTERYEDKDGKGFLNDYTSTGWFEFNRNTGGADFLDSLLDSMKTSGQLVFDLISTSGKKNWISFGELPEEAVQGPEEVAAEPVNATTTGLFGLFAIFMLINHRRKQ